jgi:Fe-S cluster biogenesis protein NfuA
MFKQKVQQVLEDLMPYIASHGGNIVLLSADEMSGVVEVELQGACVGCPLSHLTLKHGVEDEMRKRIEGFETYNT